jgi:excisionase family DNA binding protein
MDRQRDSRNAEQGRSRTETPRLCGEKAVDVFTIHEVAEQLRLSVTSVREEMRQERLTFMKFRKCLRFSAQDIELYIENARRRVTRTGGGERVAVHPDEAVLTPARIKALGAEIAWTYFPPRPPEVDYRT